MNVVIFSVAVIGLIATSYLALRLYFFVAVIISRRCRRVVAFMALFALLLIIGAMQVGVFILPAILSERLQIVPDQVVPRYGMLGLGAVVVIAALWFALRSSEARSFRGVRW